MKVLPVPALASRTVTPEGSGPQTSNGGCSTALLTGRRSSRLGGPGPTGAARSGRSATARTRPSRALARRRAAPRRAARRRTAGAAEGEDVLGVSVLAREAIGLPPSLARPPLRRRRRAAAGVGRARPRHERDGSRIPRSKRSASIVRPRAPPRGAPGVSPSGLMRATRMASSEPRPTVTAVHGRSGRAAVSARMRTQAARRCFGATFEKVVDCTASPRTPPRCRSARARRRAPRADVERGRRPAADGASASSAMRWTCGKSRSTTGLPRRRAGGGRGRSPPGRARGSSP